MGQNWEVWSDIILYVHGLFNSILGSIFSYQGKIQLKYGFKRGYKSNFGLNCTDIQSQVAAEEAWKLWMKGKKSLQLRTFAQMYVKQAISVDVAIPQAISMNCIASTPGAHKSKIQVTM